MWIITTGPRDCKPSPLFDATMAVLYMELSGEMKVRHGMAPGSDFHVDQSCRRLGIEVDPVPADWEGPCDFTSGMCWEGHQRIRRGVSYCPSAGPRRNQAMLDAGAGLVVSLSDVDISTTRGTLDMVTRARRQRCVVANVDLRKPLVDMCKVIRCANPSLWA
jgi:hypothetical protein